MAIDLVRPRSYNCHHMERNTVGQRIKAMREARGWTQGQLAAFAGVSRSAVSLIEAGRREPERTTYSKIAAAFGVGLDDLQQASSVPPIVALIRTLALEYGPDADPAELERWFEIYMNSAPEQRRKLIDSLKLMQDLGQLGPQRRRQVAETPEDYDPDAIAKG